MLLEWITLLRLARHRLRSNDDYVRFQAYQGRLILTYLKEQGVAIENTTVLDLGCGYGGYSQAISRAGGQVISVDLGNPKTSLPAFVTGDATKLPFASGSFTMVFCASLIEHVPNPFQVLTEIKRVLISDGFAYLSFPPFYTPVGGHQFKPYHLLGERWALRLSRQGVDSYATCFDDFGLYPLTIRRVRKLIAETGLTIRHQSTRFLPVDVSRIPGLGEFLTWHVQFLLCK